MFRFLQNRSKKAGLSPGSLIHVGEKKNEEVKITLIHYDEFNIEEKELASIDEFLPYKGQNGVTWINIDGLHSVALIEKIGNEFGIHPLVLEDILNTEQRPKLDDFDKYVFFAAKMLTYDDSLQKIEAEQFSLIFGSDYVISFQEKVGDVFNPIRERLRNGMGRIRKRGPDYLAYALLDAIVDNYFIVLDKIGERIESVDEELAGDPEPEIAHTIHHFKKELTNLSRSVWPLREVVSELEKGEAGFVSESTMVFFKDVHDHVIQLVEAIEIFREMVNGMLEVLLSGISNRMNEIMKLLTVIATIFIPLTFIAGIYGMNFKYMPELEWEWGYPLISAIMLVLAILMLIWFKRKRLL